MTKIINIFGGPGSGKSTTASGLFYKMKEDGLSVELVQEYVKKWAWEGKTPCKYDQIYITGKQCKSEYMLHGKVDFIVTDSPVMLGAFYDNWYNKEDALVDEMVSNYYEQTINDGVEYINFIIQRTKLYVEEGRYSNEAEAKSLDISLREYLASKKVECQTVTSGDVDELYKIIKQDYI